MELFWEFEGLGTDGSEQYVAKIKGKDALFVSFAIKEGEPYLIAHTWWAPGYGKVFLEFLECLANEWRKKGVEIPVPSPHMRKFLLKYDYEPKFIKVEMFGEEEVIEVWRKRKVYI